MGLVLQDDGKCYYLLNGHNFVTREGSRAEEEVKDEKKKFYWKNRGRTEESVCKERIHRHRRRRHVLHIISKGAGQSVARILSYPSIGVPGDSVG